MGKRLNARAKNSDFGTKKNRYYKQSEVKVTRDLLRYTLWTPNEVEARARKLAKKMALLWPGP